jgi:hypothetical protein
MEALECRSLLTTVSETFTGPSLTDLISQVEHGKNENTAITNRMVQALEVQLQAGPVTDLNSGGAFEFIAEAQSLESSYEQDVAKQLTGKFGKKTDLLGSLGQVLDLDGQRVVANLSSLEHQESAELVNSSEFSESAQSVIASLTSGPIHPLGTSLSGMASTTSAVESELATLSEDLAEGVFTINPGGPAILPGSSGISPAQILNGELTAIQGLSTVNLTLDAELEGYRASVQAATRVTQPGIAAKANAAINNLEAAVDSLDNAFDTSAKNDPSNVSSELNSAISQLNSAINTFDASVLGTTGVFGPEGPYSKAPTTVNLNPAGFTNGHAPSEVVNVSGTANLASGVSGTASLTATVTSVHGSAVEGQTVNFAIDGTFLGSAVTDSKGVAILSGLTTSDQQDGRVIGGVFTERSGVAITNGTVGTFDVFGTDTGGIVATFVGNTNFVPTEGKGDLVVS